MGRQNETQSKHSNTYVGKQQQGSRYEKWEPGGEESGEKEEEVTAAGQISNEGQVRTRDGVNTSVESSSPLSQRCSTPCFSLHILCFSPFDGTKPKMSNDQLVV